jgi:hypothetical protein
MRRVHIPMYMVSLVLLAQYRVLYKYWFCFLDSGLGLFGGHWSRSLIDYGYGVISTLAVRGTNWAYIVQDCGPSATRTSDNGILKRRSINGGIEDLGSGSSRRAKGERALVNISQTW